MCPDFVWRVIFETFIWYKAHCACILKIGSREENINSKKLSQQQKYGYTKYCKICHKQ